jgi:hypothetical protein
MLKQTLMAAGIAVGLVACAATSPGYVWNKPDATQSSYAADSFECKQTARATAPGGGFAMGGLAFVVIASAVQAQNTHNAQQQIFNECMAARGYTPGQATMVQQ